MRRDRWNSRKLGSSSFEPTNEAVQIRGQSGPILGLHVFEDKRCLRVRNDDVESVASRLVCLDQLLVVMNGCANPEPAD